MLCGECVLGGAFLHRRTFAKENLLELLVDGLHLLLEGVLDGVRFLRVLLHQFLRLIADGHLRILKFQQFGILVELLLEGDSIFFFRPR